MFVLNDIEEQDFWDRAGVVRRRFTRTMSSALSALNADLGEIGHVRPIMPWYLPILPSYFCLVLTLTLCVGTLQKSRAKSEFIRREQGTLVRLVEEAQRTTATKAELATARQRVSILEGELVSLHVRHAEALKDADESGEKLLAVLAPPIETKRQPRR